jgi:tetratricopeptide (TPR) repeat protein
MTSGGWNVAEIPQHLAKLERLAEAEGALSQPSSSLLMLARRFKFARQLRRDVGLTAAVRLLRQAQRERPADFWLNFELANILQGESSPDWAEIVGYYRAALAVRPQSGVVLSALGGALWRQGKLVEAEAACCKALALNPDDRAAHYHLAGIWSDQGKLTKAEAACREALRLKPDWVEAKYYLAFVLNRQEKRKAPSGWASLFKSDAATAADHLNLGKDFLNRGQPELAAAAFHEAIALKPDYAEAHNNLGDALRAQKKELVEPEVAYREAARLKPDYAEAHNNLGSALYRNKKLAEAETSLREAARLKPDYAEAHTNLGSVLRARGKWAEAEASFREALRLKPDCPAAHNDLGSVLGAQGKWAEAEASFREALRLNPGLQRAYISSNWFLYELRPLVHANLANALARQGKLLEAEAEARLARDWQPNDPDLLLLRWNSAPVEPDNP